MPVINTGQPVPITNSTMDDYFSESMDGRPQITATALLAATAKDKQSLTEIYELLDMLFVRNRNQHRRNHWFKSLQQFRKQLGLLLQELESHDSASKKAGKETAKEKMQARLRYWDGVIHGWYIHFTQLVAVGPFAVMGLVLMACVARVCRITGITSLYEDIASEDLRAAMDVVAHGHAEEALGHFLGAGVEEEDLGEVIQRDE